MHSQLPSSNFWVCSFPSFQRFAFAFLASCFQSKVGLLLTKLLRWLQTSNHFFRPSLPFLHSTCLISKNPKAATAAHSSKPTPSPAFPSLCLNVPSTTAFCSKSKPLSIFVRLDIGISAELDMTTTKVDGSKPTCHRPTSDRTGLPAFGFFLRRPQALHNPAYHPQLCADSLFSISLGPSC